MKRVGCSNIGEHIQVSSSKVGSHGHPSKSFKKMEENFMTIFSDRTKKCESGDLLQSTGHLPQPKSCHPNFGWLTCSHVTLHAEAFWVSSRCWVHIITSLPACSWSWVQLCRCNSAQPAQVWNPCSVLWWTDSHRVGACEQASACQIPSGGISRTVIWAWTSLTFCIFVPEIWLQKWSSSIKQWCGKLIRCYGSHQNNLLSSKLLSPCGQVEAGSDKPLVSTATSECVIM